MTDPAKARQLLDKLKSMSQKVTKKFDDLPDMRADGTIDKIPIKRIADETLTRMQEDAQAAGFKLEAKVIGVAVRILVLDPEDESRTHVVTSEIVMSHPEINLRKLLETVDTMPDLDARQMMSHDPDDEPYEPKSKVDGFMYG
jgi:hypothetical protein